MPQQQPVSTSLPRVAAIVLSIPVLALLAYLTLWPTRVEERMPQLLTQVLDFFRTRLDWSWFGVSQLEVISNVVVFIPVGILAFMILPRRIRFASLLVGPLLSGAIEIWQAIALPVRDATFADVVANSAGATIGVGLSFLVTLLRTRTLESS